MSPNGARLRQSAQIRITERGAEAFQPRASEQNYVIAGLRNAPWTTQGVQASMDCDSVRRENTASRKNLLTSMSQSSSLKPVLYRSLAVACVVGPTLILINQFDALFGAGRFAWGPALLTMTVPFCVSAFSGLQTRTKFLQVLSATQKAHEDALKAKEAAHVDALQAAKAAHLSELAAAQQAAAT